VTTIRATRELPHDVSPRCEDPIVAERRAQIGREMVPAAVMRAIVAGGATRRELQGVLESDPSLVAEVYADPADAYLFFAPFPIDGVCADIALLSGRSATEVTLLEIKGTSSTVGPADAARMEARLASIESHAAAVRRRMRGIRTRVERGERLYGVSTGPLGTLASDPAGPIHVRLVMIGGRMTHLVPQPHSRIRLETWESWLRHLRRD
jgi:hypothetical protein